MPLMLSEHGGGRQALHFSTALWCWLVLRMSSSSLIPPSKSGGSGRPMVLPRGVAFTNKQKARRWFWLFVVHGGAGQLSGAAAGERFSVPLPVLPLPTSPV